MRILLIAPYYAPSSEVPSVRMVSLSDYLISQGHSVTVLCYSRSMLLTMYEEKELSTKIPDGVKVIGFEVPKYKIPYRSDVLMGKYFKKHLPEWVDFNEYDVVLTTCGPYFTLEAMPMIKRKYNIPYILDFRDLGALNYRPKVLTESENTAAWKKTIKNWYIGKIKKREAAAVDNAENIICVSEIDKKHMKAAYNIPEEKLHVATNGFDEKKLSEVVAQPKQEGIVGAVFGKFMYYSKERATSVLLEIDRLRREGFVIKLMHIGRKYEWIDSAIKEAGIDPECYDSKGLKEYSDGMSFLGSADFFVVEDTSPDDIGTKIYDYIYWNKPVLAATPADIPLAKLVGGFEHGYVCDGKEDVGRALREIVENKYDCLDSGIDIQKYSRKYQNGIIEAVIKGTADRG